METRQLLVLVLVVAIAIAIAAWIIGSKLRNRRVARENVVRLATALGLAMEKKGFLGDLLKSAPLLGGTVNGRRCEFYEREVGGGKNRQTTTMSILQVIPTAKSEFTFELKVPDRALTKKLSGKQGINLGGIFDIIGQDVEIGDAAFDAVWKISTDNPEFLKTALVPELRQQIMDMFDHGCIGTFSLGNGSVQYVEYGPFHDEQRWQRFAALAPVLGLLAAVAEAHARSK